MKKVGIFLGYAPQQPIKNQGIGRLISFILAGILEDPNQSVIIAAPAWYKHILTQFLTEQHIDLKRVELLTTTSIPYLLKIKQLLTREEIIQSQQIRSQPNEVAALPKVNALRQFILTRFLMPWLSTYSTFLFLLGLIIYSLVGLILLPVFLLVFLLFASKHLLKKLKKRLSGSLLQKILKAPLRSLKNYVFAHKIYAELRKRELNRLIKAINKRKDIPIWYVPALFWPEIGKIQAKKVVAAPDIVFVELPTLFIRGLWHLAYQQVAACIKESDHFICYSEHVKQKHLVEKFAIAPDAVSVIPHGVVSLDHYFQTTDPKMRRQEALTMLRTYQKQHLQHHFYLKKFDFTDTRFLFYSSQMRPYKNILSLVKAYETLLRKEHINIKLILTADIAFDASPVEQYVTVKHLDNDVIWLPNVPANVLASLNCLALCAVNPTLFEGGFPFTFTEAYSVGTPSVMSNIPVTAALIKDENLKKYMLFDPYDLADMISKIKWAIENRDALCAMQATLYQQFTKRTWDVVAKEYVGLLDNLNKQTQLQGG